MSNCPICGTTMEEENIELGYSGNLARAMTCANSKCHFEKIEFYRVEHTHDEDAYGNNLTTEIIRMHKTLRNLNNCRAAQAPGCLWGAISRDTVLGELQRMLRNNENGVRPRLLGFLDREDALQDIADRVRQIPLSNMLREVFLEAMDVAEEAK
ncbi:MAG: hypothetical protein PHR90_06710 [Sphaerochaetaceae bacterium]|nr:hypothetical protein [Sphaerochaetaceae bacterium]